MRARLLPYACVIIMSMIAITTLANAQSGSTLTVRLSQSQIYLQASFVGERLFVFGAIDSELDRIDEQLDVAIVLKGPPRAYTVRRKQQFGGLWINARTSTSYRMPSFYELASSRPLTDIATAETRAHHTLGIAALGGAGAAYASLRQYHQAAGVYRMRPNSVEIVRNALFVASFVLPHNAPTGSYDVGFYLLHNGQVLADQHQALQVVPAGLEQTLRSFAHAWPLLYGLLAIALATLLGMLTALVLRRRGNI